ncbi:MAG: leucine-rich repeat domain-containing protein, partial [Oscillospiraceae bacterium]|nr:leucine-rich repeat domain-containing protein [Oscillospiraceae bacterium]
LTEMNLPDSVAKIAGGAFSGCERLTSVKLPYVISMGGRAFENCTSLTSIEMPYVLEIQGGAFESCTGLTSITIPASVTTIRSGAFRNCLNLKTVTFVGDAPKMESLAFGGEHPYEEDTVVTATAYYPEGNPTWTEEILQDYGGNMTWISYTPEVEEEDGSAGTPVASGSGGENVRWELDSKGKLRVFGTGAIADSEEPWITDRKKSPWYDYRMKIKSAVIEDSVTRIGNYAFEDCTFLETVTICDSVTHIGNGAFWNCLRLKYLTIGKGVAVLEGSNVFDGCSSLMHVNISDPSAWCNMECSFFSHPMHHYNKDYLHVLDADGNEVTEIVLDESVRTIVQNTFRNSSLTSITFSPGLTRIDTQAFIGSSKLRQLTFTGDAPSIDEKAFQDVTATAYYHEGNPTWTSDVLQNYGGNITWVAKCTNHSVIVEGIVQPTCTRTGTTGKVSCENCGEVLAESKELPMLDHQWDKGVDADGVRTYQCLYCGTTDTKQLPPADMTTAQPEISETLMDSILTKNEKSEVSNGAQVE